MNFTKTLLILSVLFVGAPPLHAQVQIGTNLIPRQTLFAPKDKHDLQLAKDGKTVFFRRTPDGRDSALFLVHGHAPHTVLKIALPGALRDFRPAHTGKVLCVVRRDSALALYAADPATLQLDSLPTPPIRSFGFTAESPLIPNKWVVRLEQVSGRKGYFLLDLHSGHLRPAGLFGGFDKVFFDHRFQLAAAQKRNAAGGNTLLVRSDQGWDTLAHTPFHPDMFLGGFTQILSVSGDGKTVWFTSHQNRDKAALFAYDRPTQSSRLLAEDPKADILPLAASFDPQNNPTSVVALFADTRRHIINPDYAGDFAFLEKNLPGQVGWAGASADGQTWLVRALTGGPERFYLYQRPDKKLTPLFSDHEALEGYNLATRHAFAVRTRDGLELPVHVYLPPDADQNDDGIPRSPLPTVIYVHGGPWLGLVQWNRWFFTRNFQLLANRGYAVINMEFRGTTGLGKAMTDAGDRQWGKAMLHDIEDVAQWAVSNGIAHPDRLGIWGWSYGGYAAAAALAFAPERFACGISMYGPYDMEAFGLLPFTDNELWRTRVGNPNTPEGAALLREISPAHHVERIRAPLYLSTGGKDERVPQKLVDEFARKLVAAGKDVLYTVYPEEGHDYRAPESWISFWAIGEAFLHRHLGGAFEPYGEDLEKGDFQLIFGELPNP